MPRNVGGGIQPHVDLMRRRCYSSIVVGMRTAARKRRGAPLFSSYRGSHEEFRPRAVHFFTFLQNREEQIYRKSTVDNAKSVVQRALTSRARFGIGVAGEVASGLGALVPWILFARVMVPWVRVTWFQGTLDPWPPGGVESVRLVRVRARDGPHGRTGKRPGFVGMVVGHGL